jgi:periplasmic protein TonB
MMQQAMPLDAMPRSLSFSRMLLVAIALHVLGLGLLVVWPRSAPDEIPVRTLNVTFGAPENVMRAPEPLPEITPEPVPSSPPPSPPVAAPQTPPPAPKAVASKERSVKIEDALKAQAPETQPRPPAQQPIATPKPIPSAGVMPNKPSQHVRQTAAPVMGVAVSDAAPMETAAQAIARYEQQMSAWLQQHRVVPPMARQLGQHGTPVLRVRINRQGAVSFFAIDRSSGFALIDDAAMDMVRRANPFPAPPASYPGGALLEFLIPVTFDLK